MRQCSHPVSGNFKLSVLGNCFFIIKLNHCLYNFRHISKHYKVVMILKGGYPTCSIHDHQFWIESLKKEHSHLNFSLLGCKTCFLCIQMIDLVICKYLFFSTVSITELCCWMSSVCYTKSIFKIIGVFCEWYYFFFFTLLWYLSREWSLPCDMLKISLCP